jgi:hypothetical protein
VRVIYMKVFISWSGDVHMMSQPETRHLFAAAAQLRNIINI